MKRTKRGFVSTLIGFLISFVNAIIQFLLIYWVMEVYGTEFNGFIRLSSAFSIVGGTTEGALGISTVILLMKPLENRDFISANEIYSTAKTRYRKNIIIKSVLIVLIAVFYPLEIMIGPNLIKGEGKPVFEMVLNGGMVIPVYQLMIIVLFFGFKNIVTSGLFGVYENIIQADQQNGIRRLIILFTDVLIYGVIFALLNVTINKGTADNPVMMPLNPMIPFSTLLLYGFLRGALIKLYVVRNYKWLTYYREFNNFALRKSSGKMFWSSIGQAVLFNSDIVLVVIGLGAYGLQTSSMLSLYLIVGLNTRLIMTNFIISFREYFISIMVKEGRLEWKAYANYELYIYVVAAFSFMIMTLMGPYLVNGLYGQLVQSNLDKLQNSSDTLLNVAPLSNARDFMFQKPLFSILYGLTTAFILIIQGQYTLIQAKGRVGLVSKWIDIIAIVFLIVSLGGILIFSIPQKNDNFIVNSLIVYYSIKVIFMFLTVVFLWFFNWTQGTYNSSFKYVVPNLISFLIPLTLTILGSLFILEPYYPVIQINGDQIKATFDSWKTLLLYLLIVILISLATTTITALAIRPKVAISLVLMLPVIKQIVDNSKKNSRYKRLREENIDLKYYDNEDDLNYAFVTLYSQNSMEYSINTVINVDDIFKPKIYKIKNETIKKPKKVV